jgi:hypothetical protein
MNERLDIPLPPAENIPNTEAYVDIKKGDRVTWKPEVVQRAKENTRQLIDPVNPVEGDEFVVLDLKDKDAVISIPTGARITVRADLLKEAA